LDDTEFFAASPACQSAAAIAAASESEVIVLAEGFVVTEVAVAGLASGFAFGVGKEAGFFAAADLAT
jgi:hypothetical protein